ncbi:MAG TPA: hypothetical protein VN962_08095 [Polyangia bacterium]|nr:hypothetical protein [Polyangia bacterium]
MGRPAIVFVLLSQLGCVLYDRQIALVAPAAGRDTRRTCGPGRPIVTVNFVDGRATRGPVGAVRNGYYMTMSHVLTQDDLGVWATRAVADALGRSGDCVVVGPRQPGSPAASGGSLDVAGALTSAWADAYFTYWGDVRLDVTLTDPAGRAVHKTYLGHGSAGANVAASEAGYAEALQYALADAVSQVVRDVNAFRPPPG